MGQARAPFYTVAQADKEGVNVYSAGELVYELVSPDDDAFVMQSSSMPPDELATLGDRLTLAEGWEFQSRTFDEELALTMDEKVKGRHGRPSKRLQHVAASWAG